MQMLAPFTEAIANSSAMLEGLEPFVQPPPKNKSRSKKSKTSNVVSLFPAQSESNLPQAPQCKGYQLKITLKRVKPAIWRRITAPAQCSLAELHCVIQEAMGWHDEHLHEFLIDKRRFADCQQDPFTSDVHDFELGSFNFQVGSKFVYVYDFGDGWEHSIEVEKLLDADALEASDVFINGKGGCPPEDCGGPYGFMQLLETLKTDGPEKEELVEWLGDDYDPQQLPDCFSGKKVRSKKTVAKKAAHESRISSPASP
jgi:hypothetical protein